MKRALLRLLVFGCLVLVIGCASDQEKSDKFLAQGQASYDTQDFNQAVIQIKNAIALTPKSLEAHRLLAQTYLKLGDARQAFNTLLKIEQLAPGDLDNTTQVASFYLLGRQVEEAKKRVDQVLAKKPDHIQALYLRAGILSDDPASLAPITQIYSQILVLDPKQARAHLALARIAAAGSEFGKAEDHLKQAVAVSPDNTNIYKTLFDFYMSRNRPQDGLAVLKDLARQMPDQADPYLFLGNFYLGTNQPLKAEAEFKTAIDKDPDNINAYMLLARLLNTQGRATEAEGYIRKAMAAAPDNFTVKNAYAEFHFSRNEFDKAAQMADEILAARPDFMPAKILSGKLLAREGQHEKAIRLFTELIKEEPDAPALHFLLGSALFENGEMARAKSALSKTLEKDPGHTQARVLMAGIHFREKDYGLAEDQVRQVLARAPDHYQANLIMGNILMTRQENTAARQIFTRMTELSPNTPAAFFRLGILDRAEKNYDQAIAHFNKALALNPSLMDVFSALVSVYALQGQYDQGLAAIDTHFTKTGDNDLVGAVLLNLKGNLLLSKPDKPGAAQAYAQAIAKNPKYVSPYLTLAKLQASDQAWDKAEQTYKALIENRPDQALAYGLLGSLYERQGNTDQAEALYLKAMEIDPDHIPALNNLAYLYAEQDRELNRALDLARKAKERLGRIPAIMDTLGWVYYKKGLFDSAAAEFEACVRLEPQNPVFHYHLGLALHQLGKSAQAKAALQKALELNTEFSGAGDARSLLEGM